MLMKILSDRKLIDITDTSTANQKTTYTPSVQ